MGGHRSLLITAVRQLPDCCPPPFPPVSCLPSPSALQEAAARARAEALKAPFSRELAARAASDGSPKALLREAVVGRQRVAVTLRSGSAVRGTMKGTLVAFDKHWNMVRLMFLCVLGCRWR